MEMAESLITKRALAASLKELMMNQPLSKISIGDICENCGMNRKSFYYHFCDKYDLVNWIFDNGLAEMRDADPHTLNFEDICDYFYSERDFYRNALQITGQNSFRDYFRQQMYSVLIRLFGNIFENEKDADFLITFLADGTVSALLRWLNEPEPEPPQEIAGRVRRTLVAISEAVVTAYNEE